MLHPRNSPAAACKGSRFRISGSFLWAARLTPAAWSGASRHYCWLLRKRISLCGRCAPLRWRCPLNPTSGFAPWNPKFRSVGAARFFESGSHRRYAMRASFRRCLLRQLYVQAFIFHLSSFIFHLSGFLMPPHNPRPATKPPATAHGHGPTSCSDAEIPRFRGRGGAAPAQHNPALAEASTPPGRGAAPAK